MKSSVESWTLYDHIFAYVAEDERWVRIAGCVCVFVVQVSGQHSGVKEVLQLSYSLTCALLVSTDQETANTSSEKKRS